MKIIKLTKGYETMVDDEDFEFLNQWKWHALKFKGGIVYATRTSNTFERQKGFPKNIYLHRCLLNYPKNFHIDHVDNNGLNNTRVNLRLVTHSQNQQNAKLSVKSTSKYKGVYYHKKNKRYAARIGFNHRQIHLGNFLTAIEAAKTYNKAAVKYFGSYARLNLV